MRIIKSQSLLAIIGLTWTAAAALAADRIFETDRGAIRGYDPVAYHIDGKPQLGAPDITFEWEGATWHFASTANRDAFTKEPEHYAPLYGGYCAYGTSNGYKVSTEPEAFAIENGKLYLNYSVAVQTTWNKDRPGYIRKADTNWTTLKDEIYESDEATIAKQKAK